MLGFDQPSHWLVLIAIAAVLFGYKRLPDASRSLGRSLRIFKTEIKGMGEDDKARDAAAAPAVAPQAELSTPAEVTQPATAPVPAPAETAKPAE